MGPVIEPPTAWFRGTDTERDISPGTWRVARAVGAQRRRPTQPRGGVGKEGFLEVVTDKLDFV